jgi:hypothetical protein
MAYNFVPDAWVWITSLPPFSQWRTTPMPLYICTTSSASASSQPSMNLSVVKAPPTPQPSYITFSIFANYRMPISLWTSKPIHLKTKSQQTLDEQDLIHVFVDIVNSVLWYGSDKKSSFRFPPAAQLQGNFKDVFNIAFLSLAFLVSIYESPHDLRPGCLDSLRIQLTSSKCKAAAKKLIKMLGANLEDQWMKIMNLAVTNWIVELQPSNHSFRVSSPLFSYALSASGLWKVQLYCPVIAMGKVEPAEATQDERLLTHLSAT